MSKSSVKITTTTTYQPFRCVVCGYLNEVLSIRREALDPWQVGSVIDEVYSLTLQKRGPIPVSM